MDRALAVAVEERARHAGFLELASQPVEFAARVQGHGGWVDTVKRRLGRLVARAIGKPVDERGNAEEQEAGDEERGDGASAHVSAKRRRGRRSGGARSG